MVGASFACSPPLLSSDDMVVMTVAPRAAGELNDVLAHRAGTARYTNRVVPLFAAGNELDRWIGRRIAGMPRRAPASKLTVAGQRARHTGVGQHQ